MYIYVAEAGDAFCVIFVYALKSDPCSDLIKRHFEVDDDIKPPLNHFCLRRYRTF